MAAFTNGSPIPWDAQHEYLSPVGFNQTQPPASSTLAQQRPSLGVRVKVQKQERKEPSQPIAPEQQAPPTQKSFVTTSTDYADSQKRLKYTGNFHLKEHRRTEKIQELKPVRISSEDPKAPLLAISKYNANVMKR